MQSSDDGLSRAFQWASRVIQRARQYMSDPVPERSVMIQGQGTDSDFTAKAAGWEAACCFLQAAGHAQGWEVNLEPWSTCEPQLQLREFMDIRVLCTLSQGNNKTALVIGKNKKMQTALTHKLCGHRHIFDGVCDNFGNGAAAYTVLHDLPACAA